MLIYLMVLDTEEERIKFVRLYEEYRNRMHYTASILLKSEIEAEDIVHDTFLTLTDYLLPLHNPVWQPSSLPAPIIFQNPYSQVYPFFCIPFFSCSLARLEIFLTFAGLVLRSSAIWRLFNLL